MAYEEVLYEVSEQIATVTLNRPTKLNAWTNKMGKEVAQAVLAADADDQVRVIIVTGAGRGFCAGADMANLGGLAASDGKAETIRSILADHFKGPHIAGAREDFQKAYSYFPALGKPVIGAINGAAAGLGLVISLYCDIRFASDQAKFGTAFAKRGLIAEHGISWMLPRLIGVSNALDLLYSARMIDAAEALRMNLVSRVIPHEELLAETRKYALELANGSSPRSQAVMKRQVYNALFQDLGAAIETANEEMIHSFTSEDFKEGVAHFMEKRLPAFTGK